ncbi:thiamine pyrophosphate-dependent dehydrogenase E1 component subunit alpha [Nocardioides immobilis]|uniref:Thiamine pyrophosphate-dependent dehydrogenase E1 component subunit alpha n=1 Tax=Nocardioides immobilis TaxID=2049295 RepID=A0A417Y6S2_9ACTN|nr:thiamine pyrophosphate-dependent dehydrogenase E1 component subunit alpha [Nocardioides immobilis]RHW28383.1 thiamine pyrophosphate-dependent dehydrogenase E1 component subunit alpha [Nocardioides immobilis]
MTIVHDPETGIDRNTAIDLYRSMRTIRQFETTAGDLFAAGKLPGFIHLSIGQEAVAAGVCAPLEDSDYITTTHRGHGHCLAKGGRMREMMGELFGREGGYALGRSGSMHIADNSVGILGANAIVGGGIPMAVGGALAAKLTGDGQVSVSFFGDGAAAEGVLHECLNIAALWKLPIVFVCEHNGYAEMTPVSVHLANPDVAALAAVYGIPAVKVNGNDVAAVLAASHKAVARARAGEGPSFIEARTNRWRGHFEGDPQKYRHRDELNVMSQQDPLKMWHATLTSEHGLTRDDLDLIDAEIRDRVLTSAAEAEAMAPSDPAGLTRHVYPEAAR